MILEPIPQQVRVYVSKEGQSPYSEWIQDLKDVRGRAIIRTRVNRVRTGNFGNCESVGEGVFELKINFGPGYRVYFGREGADLVLLLCGGDKGSQDRDIKKAHEYWLDYKKRGTYGEE